MSTRLQGSKSALWFVVLAGLGLVLPGLALPIFSKIFVDNVLVAGIKSWVAPLLLGLMLTAVLRAALTSLQQKALLRLETKLSVASSSRFFWHLLHLPVEFYTQRSAGELAQRVAINDRIASLLSGQLATSALGMVTAVFFLFLMVRYDPILTLVALVSAALNIAALAWVSKRRTLENQKLLMETGKVMGTTVIGLQLIESLKAGGLESDFYARWAGFQAKASNAEARLGVMTRTLNVVPPLLAALNTALVLGVGGVRVMSGDILVGTLVAFQTLMVSFLDPVNRMVALASSLQEAEGDMQRIDDVLRYPQRESSTRLTQTAPPSGHIELRNVTFGYSRLEAPLIEGFNLSLKPGSRVALVGGSGSGKSTIARLVCGLNEPWDGEILFDGAPRESWPDHIWSGAFSVVDQEIFLFSGSVRDNLTLWDNTVPEADMVQATHDACIHDAIASRPNGYNSSISEGGSNFSGGQRQRLEIARALVSNPSIVIMDEATSALDSVTEKIVDDNLRRRGCTCLIIAHRLSTIRDCDEIVVLQRGKVVQRGTHENMMRESGPYKTLISAE